MSLITVIIPVHNTEKYLRKCIESVRNQTLEDLEILLVENLSTDNSPAICDEYARTDPRIKVLHLDKSGVSNARNEGIQAARSPFITFVDSDDFVDNDMLQTLFGAMQSHHADMACCNHVESFDDGSEKEVCDDSGETKMMDTEGIVKAILTMEITSSPCGRIYKKELFRNIMFPLNRYFEDHAIMHLVASRCKIAVWVKRPCYHYLQNATSICHTLTAKKYYDFFLADYGRLTFINSNKKLLHGDWEQLAAFEADRCFRHFRTFMRLKSSTSMRKEQLDMREKLSQSIGLTHSNTKLRKRIWTIRHCFPLFYLAHIAFRRN